MDLPTHTSGDLTADVVVVGAGAAGAVLASRLAAAGVDVLVVEAGGRVRTPLTAVPKGFVRTLLDPELTSSHAADGAGALPDEAWVRGRGVGGSTIVNGSLFLPGEPHLQAAAGRLMGAGWGADDWQRAGDGVIAAASRAGRRLSVAPVDPVIDTLLDTLVAQGIPRDIDLLDGDGPRCGLVPATIHRGRAWHAGDAFLSHEAPTLRVLTGTTVETVTMTGPRATGLVGRTADGADVRCHARREVVVCAGTIGSPGLLERSGIGDPDVLGRAGIACAVPLPAVGEGLREQRQVRVVARLRGRTGLGPRLGSPTRMARELARYAVSRRGPVATGAYEAAALLPGPAGESDILLLATALATDETGLGAAPWSGLTLTAYPIAPTSTGSIHVASPGPGDPPRIHPPGVASETDRALTAHTLRLLRGLLTTGPLDEIVAAEVEPGATTGDDVDGAVTHALAHGGGIYHAVGTCACAPDGVVDDALRVRGVEGLRVADLSVLPVHTSGLTQGPAMSVGLLAAERVLAS